jgi:hypothetical protein
MQAKPPKKARFALSTSPRQTLFFNNFQRGAQLNLEEHHLLEREKLYSWYFEYAIPMLLGDKEYWIRSRLIELL